MKYNIEGILPIVLMYEENGMMKRTIDCLRASGFTQWIVVDREGVGSMSAAFNRGINKFFARSEYWEYFNYIWFVTNVEFPAEMPQLLLETLQEQNSAVAVHPAFESDHPHIKNTTGVESVPFIEWTAPLVWAEAFAEDQVGVLDEKLPYVHFDLDWSYRAKQRGWDLYVNGRTSLKHTYLWQKRPEKISELRSTLRTYRHPASVARMREKWGNDWVKKLCPTNTCG